MATPGLVKLNKKYAEQGVVFIGVAVNDGKSPWAAYIEKNKMELAAVPRHDTQDRHALRGRPLPHLHRHRRRRNRARAQVRLQPAQTPGWIEDEIKRTLKKKGTE